MTFDDTDRKILAALVENSRLSLREIAKKADISVATAMHRLKRMNDDKIISRYTTKIDYEKIGFDVQALVEIKISKGKLFEVEKRIANHPNVFAIYDVTGTSDAVILARFSSTRKMDNFLKKLQTYEFVQSTETKLILNTIKEEYLVPQE